MYTFPELIVIAAVALLVGAGIGLALARMFNSENQRNRELEKQLQAANRELKEYEQEVSEHYVKTAKLVDDLTESYREVHNHLAEGAATLLNTRGAAPLMKTIPSREQIDAISEPAGDGNVLPPLDYAPKKSPDEKGMLDESFGLDKDPKEEETAEDPLKEFYQTEDQVSKETEKSA